MNLTKKIATLGALAVVGAFTVSNAANVGVINEEAIYTGYNGLGAIQMQIDKLRAEYSPKLESEFKKLNNFKTDAEKQAYFDKNIRGIQEKYNQEEANILAPLDKKIGEAVQAIIKEKDIDVLAVNPSSVGVVKDGNQVINLIPDVVARINK
ncbi:OmpH family outer membrane protein [Veillonella sp. VA142]|uniref:OmpH family outer membrane protein n=1 Tax=Veillonella sp. VA142 TaxID=741834 RepID=UPI000F8CE20E|nr:OmpH family outer membrane protein [Veillonella sp. VA142]